MEDHFGFYVMWWDSGWDRYRLETVHVPNDTLEEAKAYARNKARSPSVDIVAVMPAPKSEYKTAPDKIIQRILRENPDKKRRQRSEKMGRRQRISGRVKEWLFDVADRIVADQGLPWTEVDKVAEWIMDSNFKITDGADHIIREARKSYRPASARKAGEVSRPRSRRAAQTYELDTSLPMHDALYAFAVGRVVEEFPDYTSDIGVSMTVNGGSVNFTVDYEDNLGNPQSAVVKLIPDQADPV